MTGEAEGRRNGADAVCSHWGNRVAEAPAARCAFSRWMWRNVWIDVASKLPTIYTISTKHRDPTLSVTVSNDKCMDDQTIEHNAFYASNQIQLRKDSFEKLNQFYVAEWKTYYVEQEKFLEQQRKYNGSFLKRGPPISPRQPIHQTTVGDFCVITIERHHHQ